MPYFHWSEAMSVGVEALDADHRCMIRIINLLHSLQSDTDATAVVNQVLETLKAYGRVHFKREERVMEVARFPGAAFHQGEHQGFMKYMELLRARYGRSDDPTLARDLFDYLTGWLRHHILIQDMAYKPYVSNVAKLEGIADGAAPPLPETLGTLPGNAASRQGAALT